MTSKSSQLSFFKFENQYCSPKITIHLYDGFKHLFYLFRCACVGNTIWTFFAFWSTNTFTSVDSFTFTFPTSSA